MSNINEYAMSAYRDIQAFVKESDIFDQVFKMGISGSFNDQEGVETWSDLDILFILKCDEIGNIKISTLIKLREIHKKIVEKYPDLEISFLTHTYNDLENYVSFGYLENYKFATFDIENDSVSFKEYIENIISERNISEKTRKRYVVYHLRHFRFNLLRKVVCTQENKATLKMIVDKIIETMILYFIFFDKTIQGKENRKNNIVAFVKGEIHEIYKNSLEMRNRWKDISDVKIEEIETWLKNLEKIESYILENNNYSTPEEHINLV